MQGMSTDSDASVTPTCSVMAASGVWPGATCMQTSLCGGTTQNSNFNTYVVDNADLDIQPLLVLQY